MKLTDLMPMPIDPDSLSHRLLRMVECLEGQVLIDVVYQPQPDYGQHPAQMEPIGNYGWLCQHGAGVVILHSEMSLSVGGEGAWVAGTCELSAMERRQFDVIYASTADDAKGSVRSSAKSTAETINWWENWFSQCSYDGPYPEAVMRSCLTLKLLTYQSSGAVVAAVTTSLPESMESGRNWDYRYCWLRDTSLLLQSFIDMGFEQESKAFLGWLLRVGRKPRLKPLYDLNGYLAHDEIILPHLEGYRGRGPVRIGNSAHHQLQLDIYGELIQTTYRFVARGGRLSAGEKKLLVGLGRSVCKLWRQPDQSIWETRTRPRHYTYSKLMCWVALGRLIALHKCVSLNINETELRREQHLIRQEIDSRGFNATLGSYVGYFDGNDPDASLLLMVRYGYTNSEDHRMQGTYRCINQKLSANGFLYRYPPGAAYDGFEGKENLFAACSFWEVDYLARSEQVKSAQHLFERLLSLANDVGLYSEQFDAKSHQALGNFPQAFTHSGLITAALAIQQAQSGKRGQQITT